MLPKGAKIIGISAITYIDKTGKRKTITSKKRHGELFKKLDLILKKAEKEGSLFLREKQ
jgi:hypothetical protein